MSFPTLAAHRQGSSVRASLLLLVAVLAAAHPAVSAAPTPITAAAKQDTPYQAEITIAPFTLTATLDQNVPEGQPVALALALHNSGPARQMVGGSAFEESAFRITLTDSAGQVVPLTALGKRVLTPEIVFFRNRMIVLDPGQTLRYRFDLARLFDLSRAGDYTVSVRRTLFPWDASLPTAGQPKPPKQIELALTALKLRLVEDVSATSGPTAQMPLPDHQTFLYVFSQYPHGIVRYRIGEDGRVSLALDSSSPLAASLTSRNGGPISSPDGRFLYVAQAENETDSEDTATYSEAQFQIGNEGVLSPLSPPSVPAKKYAGPLLMDPKGRYLYNLSGTVYALGSDGGLKVAPIVSEDAQARESNSQAPAAFSGTIDPTGRFLYTWNGKIRAYRIGADGYVTPLSTPDLEADQCGGRANIVAMPPSGKIAFVGISTQNSSFGFDQVVPMSIGDDGSLSRLPGAQTLPAPPLLYPGYQPVPCTSLVVDPTGRTLVAVGPDYLDCYRIGIQGSLTPLGMTKTDSMITHYDGISSVFFGPVPGLLYVRLASPLSLTAFRIDDKRGLVPSGLDMPSDFRYEGEIASAVAPTPLRWGQASEGLEVSARLPAEESPAGKPLALTAVLKNVTSHPIRLSGSMAAFHLSLIGPQHQLTGASRSSEEPAAEVVPLLAAGHDLLDALGSSSDPLVLPPGGERQYRFVLSRLADLTLAGNYTVRVNFMLSDGRLAASPLLYFLLDGPPKGVTRSEQELSIP